MQGIYMLDNTKIKDRDRDYMINFQNPIFISNFTHIKYYNIPKQYRLIRAFNIFSRYRSKVFTFLPSRLCAQLQKIKNYIPEQRKAQHNYDLEFRNLTELLYFNIRIKRNPETV